MFKVLISVMGDNGLLGSVESEDKNAIEALANAENACENMLIDLGLLPQDDRNS